MAYAEIEPAEALRPWVECFWTRREEESGGENRVLPDGCADLVFDLTGGEAMAVGTMTRPLVVPSGGDLLGVRFRPGRAAAFLRIPLAEITDAQVSLGDLWRNACGGQAILPVQTGGIACLPLLEAELLRRLAPDRDPRVDGAIRRIVATGGAERVETVAREIGISRQHLARQFLHHVGVSPKTFARVVRFRRVMEDRRSRLSEVDWSRLALEHGYYDQSHLIADFRELAGATPSSFHFSNP
jgi:AraC-like DNA-binding protein